MKLMKRALALLLCFLMLSNGPISAFATESVSDNDVVVETTTTTETVEVCEECGGSDAHTETCSFNTINTLNTEAPTETTQPTTAPTEAPTENTQPTTTPTETTGDTVSGNDAGCTECGETEGHLDICSQYVTPTEETTEPTTTPTEEVTEPTTESTTEPTTEPTTCEHCGAELAEETVHTEECPLYEAPVVINVFADLMAAESVEVMYTQVLDIVNGDDADCREALMNLTYDELEELRARVNELDPEGDDTDTADMLDMLSALPNAECPDCGLIGEHEKDCPRYQVEVLLPGDYIYFDLSRGSVSFKTDGTYTGYLNGQTITGKHNNDNKYYIFQGDGTTNYTNSLPTYSNVTYQGQDWGDFITNHPSKSSAGDDSVDELIASWDAADKGTRKYTVNKITFQTVTSNTTFNVTIDNLWSTHQGIGSSPDAALSFQAIGTKVLNDDNTDTFTDAATNVTVNLTVKGDNRLSRLHCATHDGQNSNYRSDTNHTNNINITGDSDATLTLANMSQNLTGSSGAYTAGLIGGTDRCDHSFKMKFETITIYAGGGRLDFGSAIGGGGNGPGRITINSGRITAVNSSTGAAIGGGCGTSGPGGYGNVTINGGSVYAYNYKPHYTSENDDSYTDAMPTAIGGGSSGLQIGGTGIVKITGGYVYAYSEVGNAIGGGGGGNGQHDSYGGGAYNHTYGGTADVTISGSATVDAISGLGCAIGGGPGGGRLYKAYADYHDGQLPTAGAGSGIMNIPVNGDGGTAKLTITGNPTIRSGSIGGGSPLDQNRTYGSTVGAAVVNISGGTIHGQVVMDGVIKNVPSEINLTNGQLSSFTMSGGLIDNTPIGNQYHFVEENGGAVYINSGSAKMSGGEIRDASSPFGGAIYLQGGDFELSGTGLIQDCTATELGGAVYVKGGDVTVSGGTIQKCTAPNGGAAYVTGGSFTMSGGTIGSATEADTNTANNGAGVYVNGGQFTMSGGRMIGNKADQNGGAAYVTGGDFTMSGGTIGGEGTGEANTAINGAGVYVSGSATTGKVEITGGSITANKATTNGGAAYVSGGNITMKGGTINKNTAINGAGVYVTGGEFDMISGSLTNNVATSYGGGAYVHGGNITIGVQDCNATGETHTILHSELTHPVVENNDASFGGGLAADGGTINIYCGKIVTNTADNAGMGHNIFMYDHNTADEEIPHLNHINGQVGEDEDHGMVVIGGELKVPMEGNFITINYHGNDELKKLQIWVSEAPETYYLNLPYCPQDWEDTQKNLPNPLTFVGWTYDMDGDQTVEDSVDLSFIRDKEDYKALGDPVQIRKEEWKKLEAGGYYIDFYAVWAPLSNKVSYEVKLDNYGSVEDQVYVMDSEMQGENSISYAFNQTEPATIVMTNPEKAGYTFMGWQITPSKATISNWSNESNAVDETEFYGVNDTDKQSGTETLATYGYKYENGKFILITDRNFGDITLTAVFEEQTAEYTYILVGPINATNFGTMTAQDASETCTTETENQKYIVTIGQVTGNPGAATAGAEYGFKLKGWFLDSAGTQAVEQKGTVEVDEKNPDSSIQKATLTPTKVDDLYPGGTFYAVIEDHLADLIIRKTATGSHSSDQTFIFEVYQEKNLLTTVTLKSGESVTIKDLTIGTTYTVKEVGGWSWRFDATDKNHKMVPVADAGNNPNTLAFTNTQTKNLWLTDNDFVLNKYKSE